VLDDLGERNLAGSRLLRPPGAARVPSVCLCSALCLHETGGRIAPERARVFRALAPAERSTPTELHAATHTEAHESRRVGLTSRARGLHITANRLCNRCVRKGRALSQAPASRRSRSASPTVARGRCSSWPPRSASAKSTPSSPRALRAAALPTSYLHLDPSSRSGTPGGRCRGRASAAYPGALPGPAHPQRLAARQVAKGADRALITPRLTPRVGSRCVPATKFADPRPSMFPLLDTAATEHLHVRSAAGVTQW
jgi:hypothetical protein